MIRTTPVRGEICGRRVSAVLSWRTRRLVDTIHLDLVCAADARLPPRQFDADGNLILRLGRRKFNIADALVNNKAVHMNHARGGSCAWFCVEARCGCDLTEPRPPGTHEKFATLGPKSSKQCFGWLFYSDRVP